MTREHGGDSTSCRRASPCSAAGCSPMPAGGRSSTSGRAAARRRRSRPTGSPACRAAPRGSPPRREAGPATGAWHALARPAPGRQTLVAAERRLEAVRAEAHETRQDPPGAVAGPRDLDLASAASHLHAHTLCDAIYQALVDDRVLDEERLRAFFDDVEPDLLRRTLGLLRGRTVAGIDAFTLPRPDDARRARAVPRGTRGDGRRHGCGRRA